jgi:DNA polymerase III sliding clamp (beta) subunit (PCNA family)
VISADKFRDIVRESVDDTLSIETVNDQAHIKGQDSHFKIFTQPASEFSARAGFRG